MVWDLWDNIKDANIHITGSQSRGKKKEKNFIWIIAENSPNLGKETDIKVQVP